MTVDCERYAIELSALLDRELGPEEALHAVDHLVGCSGCRSFWSAARGLETALDELRGERAADLPADLWHRIQVAAEELDPRPEPLPGRSSRSWHSRWVLRAAAAVVAAAGLAALVLPRAVTEPDTTTAFEIRSVGSAEPMGDERLLAMARELLRADPRDRAALVGILEAVERRQRRREGSVDRTAGDELVVELAAADGEPERTEAGRYATY